MGSFNATIGQNLVRIWSVLIWLTILFKIEVSIEMAMVSKPFTDPVDGRHH